VNSKREDTMFQKRVGRTLILIAGAGAGAGVMYLLDPDHGKRRLAVVRDKMIRAANLTGEALECVWRDVRTPSEGRAPTRAHWAPPAGLAVGCLGAGLAWYGASRRNVPGKAVFLLGAALVARALTNLDLAQLTGSDPKRRAIDIRKSMTIAASVERVFEFWCNYENFPTFMKRIREVRKSGNGRSRWTLAGPSGANVSCDALVTEYVPNEVLAWQTEPGSLIDHGGMVRFTKNGDGTTTVRVQMTSNSLAGALAYRLASLLGTDPETLLDDEMARMKTVLESGITPHPIPELTVQAERTKA
jgi:uncharacterized membrane protein